MPISSRITDDSLGTVLPLASTPVTQHSCLQSDGSFSKQVWYDRQAIEPGAGTVNRPSYESRTTTPRTRKWLLSAPLSTNQENRPQALGASYSSHLQALHQLHIPSPVYHSSSPIFLPRLSRGSMPLGIQLGLTRHRDRRHCIYSVLPASRLYALSRLLCTTLSCEITLQSSPIP